MEGEPRASLVSISLSPVAGQEPDIVAIASGEDFYGSLTLSADGSRLAWLTWSHPNMPWDGTKLWVAETEDGGGFGAPRQVAGSDTESIFQPGFDAASNLVFASMLA